MALAALAALIPAATKVVGALGKAGALKSVISGAAGGGTKQKKKNKKPQIAAQSSDPYRFEVPSFKG